LSNANIYLFTVDEGNERPVVNRVAREPGVIWAEVNFVNSVPEDDGYKTWGWGGAEEPNSYVNQQAYAQIGWATADRIHQGDGVVVAILDTGVFTQHEQFAGRLRLPALDVIDDDQDPNDVGPGLAWGHGTHVAGVIAAMAPGADLLPVRVLDSNGRGNTFLLAYALEWASRQPGVKVINLSLGTEHNSKVLRDVVKEVVKAGIVVVAAAGNNGTSTIQYPAGYDNVIGVTAVDGSLIKPPFANFGTKWIDMAAPGVGIMSTMVHEQGAGYATWSGTSMSTAFVSGAAVLVAGQQDVAGTALLGGIVARLVDTGTLLDALNPDYAGQLGRLLNVSAALGIVQGVEEDRFLYLPHALR
jgi:subtilisin family serine protease